MKKILYLFFAILSVSCSKKEENVLIVGTNAEFPPFEYMEDNQITGFDIDFIKEIAKELNQKIRIENLSWEGLLPALQTKKVDIIVSGMTITEDRQKIVSFSDPYYLSKEQMLITRKTDNTITSLEDLKNKKVGVVLGFTGDTLVSGMDNLYVQRFSNSAQMIMDLIEQKIDVVVLDYEPAYKYAQNYDQIKLISGNNTQEEYAIALRQEDQQLLQDINNAIKKIKNNGTYDLLLKKYFPKENS